MRLHRTMERTQRHLPILDIITTRYQNKFPFDPSFFFFIYIIDKCINRLSWCLRSQYFRVMESRAYHQ